MLQIHKGNTRGSATLESIFVLSAILLVLAVLIFAFMLLYQKSILSKAASLAAQQGAEIWGDSRKSIENGAIQGKEEKKDSIYWPLFDLGTNASYNETIDTSLPSLKALFKEASQVGLIDSKERKYAEIKKAVYKELYRGFLKPEATKLTIEYSNLFLQREIQVTLIQEIKIPLGGIKAFFDGKKTMTLVGSSTSVVSMPAEYIRNVDLGIEYAYRMKEAIDIGAAVEKIKGNTKK